MNKLIAPARRTPVTETYVARAAQRHTANVVRLVREEAQARQSSMMYRLREYLNGEAFQ